jgi:hypothetical protein
MPADILIHWGLELGGEACLACILFGCRNAAHRHGRIVGFFAHHRLARWALNALLTLAMAAITVQLVG